MTGDLEQAFQCAQEAYRHEPNNYEVRYSLALRLIDQEQYAEAEDHLKWCAFRRPDDQKLQWLLRETVKNRIDEQGPPIRQAQRPRTLR